MKKQFNLHHVIWIAFLLLFAACSDDNDEKEPEVPTPPVLSSDKQIESFVFESSKNGLKKTIEGNIDQTSNTIILKTQDWIDEPEKLIATFKGKGKVTVKETEQTNGTSTNDFTKNVIYTVTAEDGYKRDYTVALRSPQTTGMPVFKIDVENGTERTYKTETYYNASIVSN